MKDAYSFHIDHQSLEKTYWRMHEAYTAIFTRLGLDFRPVEADTGSIGGSHSHEFHVLAESGEDAIAFSDSSDFAANVELAAAAAPKHQKSQPIDDLEKFDTPAVKTIDDLVVKHGLTIEQTVKTLFVVSESNELVALVLRGDHRLNAIKAEKLPGIAAPLTMADEATVKAATGAGFGSLGPVGLSCRIIVDQSAAGLSSFVCGANSPDTHYKGANWDRDISHYEVADIREVVAGDPSPCGTGTLEIRRGIEVGHIFQLGTKYSEAMQASVLDEQGKSVSMAMGCYGIGVTRIVAAAIEQNHDDRGIIWPDTMAPFQVALVPLGMDKSTQVAETTETLYEGLLAMGIDVLLDDRKERPGVKFAEMELIGIPLRITIGDRSLEEGAVEIQGRRDTESGKIAIDSALDEVARRLGMG